MSPANEVRVGEPHRPFPIKMINLRLGVAANAVGLRASIKLDPDSHGPKTAIKKAGSDGFRWTTDFREGLERFVESADREGDLTMLGRLMVAKATRPTTSSNRLQTRRTGARSTLRDRRRKNRASRSSSSGLPRTGTTILQSMLEQDPANRSPLSWEIQHPVPPATPETLGSRPADRYDAEDPRATVPAGSRASMRCTR